MLPEDKVVLENRQRLPLIEARGNPVHPSQRVDP